MSPESQIAYFLQNRFTHELEGLRRVPLFEQGLAFEGTFRAQYIQIMVPCMNVVHRVWYEAIDALYMTLLHAADAAGESKHVSWWRRGDNQWMGLSLPIDKNSWSRLLDG